MFHGIRGRRDPPTGLRRRERRPEDAATTPPTTQNEHATQQAERAASNVGAALSGQGSGILNTFSLLSQLISHQSLHSLLIIDDYCSFYKNLSRNQATSATAEEMCIKIRDWHGGISPSNLVVFIANVDDIDFMQSKLYNTNQYLRVIYRTIDGPKSLEIAQVFSRLSRRHHFEFNGEKAIAEELAKHGDLTTALQVIRRIYNEGERTILLDHILRLPPINPSEIAEIKGKIQQLVGLEDLKQALHEIEREAVIYRQQLSSGSSSLPEKTMHMVFSGSPGTGKTMAAKLVARFFHAAGLLRKNEVREIVAASVMSEYAGETRVKMQAEVEAARGGVLFIDEAHQFGDSNSQAAKEAIQALVPLAWNYRTELIIILAGYAEQMINFFAMDPGLERRFPVQKRMNFPDYTLPELQRILVLKLQAQGYHMGEGFAQRARALLRKRMQRKSFGNAGGVDNLVGEITQRHAVSAEPLSMIVTVEDLPALVRRDARMYDEAMRELNELVGLDAVRRHVQSLINRVEFDLAEEEFEGVGDVELHPGNMLYVGPPGTGKTTIGRIMSRLLFSIGCLERPSMLVVSRGDLIGEYQGQSTPKLRAAIEQTRDGMLMIDEAYALATDAHDSYGNEIVNELVNQITLRENAGTVFVLAGYEEQMARFLERNAGLTRRFPVVIQFPNFTPEACMELARREMARLRFTCEDGVIETIGELARRAIASQREHFGNAGWVKSMVQQAADALKNRIVREQISPQQRTLRRTITLADLPEGVPTDDGAERALERADTGSTLDASWVPEEHARRLPSRITRDIPYTPREVSHLLAESSFQIFVRKADGKQGIASGFFVTTDHVMVTNQHVVVNAAEITVRCGPEAQECPARVLATNAELDLALLAVATPMARPSLPLGESYRLEPPDEIMVYGNAHVQPGEPGRIVTAHIVRNDAHNAIHLETDGDIEEGFSGGPVFDMAQGAVAGVVMGGWGRSATLHVRVEQVREMLIQLGYTTDNTPGEER